MFQFIIGFVVDVQQIKKRVKLICDILSVTAFMRGQPVNSYSRSYIIVHSDISAAVASGLRRTKQKSVVLQTN
jgi:hypothetical protein